MIVSYKWLQKYFDNELPKPEELEDVLTLGAFEVENVEKVGDDYILDIDVLPNRAHDCLSHRGIAREVAVLFSLPNVKFWGDTQDSTMGALGLAVDVKEPDLCSRYIGRRIDMVKVGRSPDWLRERIEAIGQKSINNIVDATNYVMFDVGQPLHAFDADKVDGLIVVRKARAGEKIMTLGGDEVVLDESVLVIADEKDILAIAGVKGGTKAEVDDGTSSVILEAANFNPVNVRKTSRKLNILTDSSKRFENEITPQIAALGMKEVSELVVEIAGGESTEIGEIVDVYSKEDGLHKIDLSVDEINQLLGTYMKTSEVVGIYDRLGFEYEKKAETGKEGFIVTAPVTRLDLRIKEDLIEEVGRVYGYHNIGEVEPREDSKISVVNKKLYYTNKVRNILIQRGFSEIYTSSFAGSGYVEVENPIASDKSFLRSNLRDKVVEAMSNNLHYSDLLGVDKVKIFEIGKVFSSGKENTSLCIAVGHTKSKKGESPEDDIEKLRQVFADELGFGVNWDIEGHAYIEIDFDDLIKERPAPESYDGALETYIDDVVYKIISPYPFVGRDIAVFVPEAVKEAEIKNLIRSGSGSLLVRGPELFDRFEKIDKETGKIDKVSYAFKMIFQSHEKTLTDEEVNEIMDRITEVLNSNEGWEVR